MQKWSIFVLLVPLSFSLSGRARAQCEQPKQFGLMALGIETGAALLDRPVHRWLVEDSTHPPRGIPRMLSSAGNHLGQARVLIPGLVGAYVIARLIHRRQGANKIVHVATGYIASDVMTSILKPVVGRSRPSTGDNPFTFHPLAKTDAHHSFPSGHLTHVTSVTVGIAEEFPNWATRSTSVILPGLVGWQRLYTNAHWLSDVSAGSIIGIEGRCVARIVARKYW